MNKPHKWKQACIYATAAVVLDAALTVQSVLPLLEA
jgi:hypothetical protein